MRDQISISNRLSIVTILTLTTGAAIGLWLLKTLLATKPSPPTIGYIIYGFYFPLSGITIAAILLLLRDRIFRGVTWGLGSHFLFVSGCTAAIFAPIIVTKWTQNLRFEPWYTYYHLQFFDHDAGLSAVTSFYHMWPVAAFFLLVAVLVGGANRQWYLVRGYWADGIGVWCVLAWAIPFPFIVWRFVANYLR